MGEGETHFLSTGAGSSRCILSVNRSDDAKGSLRGLFAFASPAPTSHPEGFK